MSGEEERRGICPRSLRVDRIRPLVESRDLGNLDAVETACARNAIGWAMDVTSEGATATLTCCSTDDHNLVKGSISGFRGIRARLLLPDRWKSVMKREVQQGSACRSG